ncbi:MAG: hypothetical protein K2H81_07620 [Alistipes sp.]|nr:hypothetical protein [Alistipes sp.]
MKKLYLILLATIAVSYHAAAQEPAAADTTRTIDSLQTVAASLDTRLQEQQQQELNRKIWKKRSKYFNIGYVNQKVTDKTSGEKLKSDFGASLSWGKTFYLHKKPLFGMMKFGLDWSWLDINYAKSSLAYLEEETLATFKSDVHQAEFGMQFGPSVTVNPVHHLKVGVYFRVTPSYSLLYLDETVHHHYVTFCNAGCTVAWKVVSLGIEWRWGTAKYNGITFNEDYDEDPSWEEGEIGDLLLDTPKRKFKTNSVRFYVGFRF